MYVFPPTEAWILCIMSSGSGGMNWQRWKKKKKKSVSSPMPHSDRFHAGSEKSNDSLDAVECESDTGAASSSSASTSRGVTSDSRVENSLNERPWRDSSLSKRRKKSKSKNSSSQGSSSGSPSVARRSRQIEQAESHGCSETERGREGKSASYTTAETASESATCSESGLSTSGANVENSTPKKQHREIPGFYYDEEKERYFRILPSHDIPSAVTAESIRLKEAERKRQALLDGRCCSQAKGKMELRRGSKITQEGTFLHLHSRRQRGNTMKFHFQRLARENTVKQIGIKPRCQVMPFPDRYFDGESGYISHFEIDSKQKHVLMVVSDDYLSRLWQGEIVSTHDPTTGIEGTTISNWSTVNILTTRNCKVTHTSWAQVEDGENMYALYAVSGGTTSSVQLFKCPSAEDGVSHISYRYESNHEMAWTCAWSNSPTLPAHLAIGSTRKAIVVDTLSASKQVLHTCHSDVFSQAFSRKSPVLYNGTRRGEVLGIDLRIPSRGHVDMAAVLRHGVSVCSIRLLRDESYLLAGDMGGGIKLWDVRKCAVVQEFRGHHSESHHLPVKVDSTESVVYAVGQDKYTRLWSLRSGDLLRTVPCPSACHEDNAPAAAYSQELACHAQPALFLGQERRLYWYPAR